MKKFALAGNPNSGKTTLFNVLTGSTAHVGNWPGVTVDKREGVYKKSSEPVSIVDLPGIYSLSPYTPEEVISRNYILDEKPDCVINIVDVTNLERNLYLTTQLMEIDVPVVVALNMVDMLEKNGDKIDEKQLEKRLGLPVVKVSALKGTGVEQLMEVAIAQSDLKRKGETVLKECDINHLISDVERALIGHEIENSLFHSIKLIEGDELEIKMHPATVKMVEEFKKTFSNQLFGNDLEALIADARYRYITANYSPLLIKKQKGIAITPSDKADRVLTHKWFGIPIFLVILFGMFHLTFGEDFLYLSKIFTLPTLEELGYADNFGTALLACLYDGAVFSPGVILFNLMGLITETLFGFITDVIANLGASPAIVSFVGDGVLGGLGGVLSFVPQIVFLLLLLSILEDSGYMARVAFILDRIFRKFGVSGRAFIPMIMGFGCSIPAMINTRTLADEREKTMTIRTIPFFSCGAKLPILAAVSGAVGTFLGVDGGLISLCMYVLGMTVAVISIILMRNTTQRGEISPFIMELPAYRMPSGKALMIHLWDKTKHYIQKVFTVILVSTIAIWFLSNFNWKWQFLMEEVDGVMVNLRMDESILGSIGMLIQPLFTPLGFGSQLNSNGWVFAVAAITGLIAKENVISTFGALAACVAGGMVATEEGVSEVLAVMGSVGVPLTQLWPAMIAFIVFNMTTIPCFAAVAAAKGETPKGKFKWTLLFWLASSFIAGTITYVVLSVWWTAFIFVAILVAILVGIYYNNKRLLKKENKNG
ncbi:MAG: ferrous iron transporter B [Clostridia bacterium]|nr:ferrous iron transporter B [Clostridia bacterium]